MKLFSKIKINLLANSKIFRKLHLFANAYLRTYASKYYSQYGEDIFITGFEPFKHKTSGFYVDVGCYHPLKFSNTYLLYKKGWRGINIDMNQYTIDSFNIRRPEDMNIRCAISSSTGSKSYYTDWEYSLAATLDKNWAMANLKQNRIEKKAIESKSLNELITKLCPSPPKIDLLNIDAEGHDYEILKSINLQKYRPRLIAIEHNAFEPIEKVLQNEIYKYLKSKSYKLLGFGPLTKFYSFEGIEK